MTNTSGTRKYLAALGSQKDRDYWAKRDGEHAHLEEVLGTQALDWVRSENVDTIAKLGDPEKNPLYNTVLSILDSKEKIPYISKIGEFYYNFWQDADNQRGVLRRTTLESYKTSTPVWTIVLDVDKLGVSEGESWVYKGRYRH